MSLIISKVFTYDEDAGNYIQAVEAADGQALESATRQAINNFVIGCKTDGIWSAIKASCILAGARTLSGALVPLVGAAPTNFNFVAADYNRKTGLAGDGSSKYLNSNRAGNADPLNNCHLATWKSDSNGGSNPYWIGAGGPIDFKVIGQNGLYANGGLLSQPAGSGSGLHAFSRSSSNVVAFKRPGGNVITVSNPSTAAVTPNIFVYAYSNNGTATGFIASRFAFYSIGESLDLQQLHSRLTDLIVAFATAIP